MKTKDFFTEKMSLNDSSTPYNGSRMDLQWFKNGPTKFLWHLGCIAAMLCLLFTLGVGNAWGTRYTITFKTNSGDGTSASTSTACSTIVSGGSSYLSGNLATATKVYYSGGSGLKLGTSSNAGEIKMNLTASGQLTDPTVIVKAKRYNSGTNATISVNGATAINTKSDWDNYSFKISGKITYLQLNSSKYLWIESVIVTDECNSIDVTGGTTVILPAGSTTYNTGDWGTAGALHGYMAETSMPITSNDYCVAFTQAYEADNANGLQCKASGAGIVQIAGITSTYGIDVEFQTGNSTTFNVSLTGAESKTAQSGTVSISTTSTTATLTITKSGSGAGYLKYIKIEPRTTPPCAAPTALTKGTISLSDRTAQVQPINWTSAAGKVDICYSSTNSSKPGATPGSGYTVIAGETGSTSESNTYDLNITSFAAGNYYVWARSVCDVDSKSDWVAVTGSYFTIPGHTLTINASPASSGTFTKSPNISTVVENRQVSITASPAAGYNFSSWSVSGTGATLSSTSANPTTFTMGTANATVTGTFSAKPLVSISLSSASGEVYVGQYAEFTITYDPTDILTKGTTLVSTPSYCVTTGTTNTTLKITGGRGGVTITENKTETVSIKADADNTKTASVEITVKPLPKVSFVDIIHGETFSDVVGSIEANALVYNKTTPTHADVADPGTGNDCERKNLHLVGWILKDWADANLDADSSEISGAADYIAAGSTINVSTYNGKTFYAVWGKEDTE